MIHIGLGLFSVKANSKPGIGFVGRKVRTKQSTVKDAKQNVEV